jgi:DNA-binding NtrC family response regulator
MPGESGIKLLDRFWNRHPEMRCRTILITGDTVDPETQSYAEKNGVRFHPKPFDLMALDNAVQDVLRENPSAVA